MKPVRCDLGHVRHLYRAHWGPRGERGLFFKNTDPTVRCTQDYGGSPLGHSLALGRVCLYPQSQGLEKHKTGVALPQVGR